MSKAQRIQKISMFKSGSNAWHHHIVRMALPVLHTDLNETMEYLGKRLTIVPYPTQMLKIISVLQATAC